MPTLHLAVQTQPALASASELLAGWQGTLPAPVAEAARLVLAQPGPGGPETWLRLDLDPGRLHVQATATPTAWHYFRYADATLKPLPPEPPSFSLARGDAYIAVSPSASRVADSPAVARFLHLRDYFNAGTLARGLLDHLTELAGTPDFPVAVTVLVVEAR